MHKLTCLVGTYNEAARLPSFLAHAMKWADEVVVVDKASTDNTMDITFSAKARYVLTDYSLQGHENKVEQLAFASNDWIFLMTPGEVPTKELISKLRYALQEHGDSVDIITIPKKLYSFGIHNPASPWSIGQQPMCINRKRAVISNHVHRNFSLAPGRLAFHLPYSETCHVYHPTHATAREFLRSHFDYILAEIDGCQSPEALKQEALNQINSFDFGNHNPELFGQEAAWKLYWLGCALAAWEKARGSNVPAQYADHTEKMIEREWSV